jgi:hypothetical protein
MRSIRFAPSTFALGLTALTSLTLSLACGGGSSSSSSTAAQTPQGRVDLVVSDAPAPAWSSVDVVIQKVALRPVGGGAPVVIYDQTNAASPAHLNLVDLDELGQLITGATVPAGSYDKVFVQIDPNSVALTDSANPPSTYTVAGGNVKVVGLTGFDVALNAPLVVDANGSNAVDLDFDLGHPLFIVDRPNGAPSGANGTTLYLVNFERCVRHRPHPSLASFLLRDLRGSVAAQTATTLTLATEHKGERTVGVDTTNGTIFYDLDAVPVTKSVATVVPTGLTNGKFVRLTARYQGSGQLTAVRVWYSTDPAKLRRFSPEGHVLAVDTAANTLKVIWNPVDGGPRALTTVSVDAGTNFFWHGGSPIATGTAFLANVQPGFKVQMTVADPAAATPVATNVDIERAVYAGTLGLAGGNTGLTYANAIYGAASPVSANFGTPFAWWNFTYPTLANTGSSSLVALLSGLTTPARGASTLSWNGTSSAWEANTCVLMPISQAGQITTGYSGGAMGFTPAGGSAETVTLSSTPGSACLVYQVQIQSGVVTVSPVDPMAWNMALAVGTNARIFAVPTDSGLKAYVVIALPAMF